MRRVGYPGILFLSLLLFVFAGQPQRVGASVDGEILVHRGIQHYLHGDYGKARDLLAQAAVLEPRNASLHLSVGLCHLALREYEQARRGFRHALALDPFIQRGQLLSAETFRKGEFITYNALPSPSRDRSPWRNR
jgi:Tfp pilus assembly protein PilF